MSHVHMNPDATMLRVSVETLIAQHGKWRVILTAIRPVGRRPRKVQAIRPMDLPPALRRDLGLPITADPPPVPTALSVYFRL